MKTGGLTSSSAVRMLSPKMPASPKTTIEAAACPNTTDTRLKAPNPAPRRLAGMASDIPARRAGTASVKMNTPRTSRTKATGSGTLQYDRTNATSPTMMQ